MKKLTAILFFLGSFSVFALDFSDLAGEYEVTFEFAPAVNYIIIEEDGSVFLTEESSYGLLECAGKATLEGRTLTSNVTCDDGYELSFYQIVDLTGVEDFQEFTANVYSSLYDFTIPMNFVRL